MLLSATVFSHTIFIASSAIVRMEKVHTNFFLNYIFIVVRTQCKIYTNNKNLSVQYSTVNFRDNVLQQLSRTYSSCKTETSYTLISIIPILSFPPSAWQPPFYSGSMRLTNLDTSYKWNHAVFVLLLLTYFTYLT